MTRGYPGVAVVAMISISPALAQTAAMTPAQAIAAASSAPNGSVEGVFEFEIGSTGASGFKVFLNSDMDYRSPANLSIELHSEAINDVNKRIDGHAEDLLKGKRVRVKGIARRVPIPRRDGTTYYQTRIEVDLGSQIEILG
jgi:hypothetical protein